MEKKQARRVDPFIRYAMVAGKKALEHAGLSPDEMAKLDKSRCGIVIRLEWEECLFFMMALTRF